jgi:hypothetical protein
VGPALATVALLAAGLGMTRLTFAAREPAARAAGGLPHSGVVGVLAADLVMLRAESLYTEGRWAEMHASFETLGRLQPRLASAWEYRGWHLAYNLAGGARDASARERWVVDGVKVLEEGLRRNPDSVELRFYLGHVLQARSRRWPGVERALRRHLEVDPVDRSIELLREAVDRDPLHGRAVVRLSDGLGTRGMALLRAVGTDEPSPPAAEDFAEAAAVLRALAGEAPVDAQETIETLAAGFDEMRRSALSRDEALRRRVLQGE